MRVLLRVLYYDVGCRDYGPHLAAGKCMRIGRCFVGELTENNGQSRNSCDRPQDHMYFRRPLEDKKDRKLDRRR